MPNKIQKFILIYLKILILTLVFGGFLTNYISLGSNLNAGTVATDVMILFSIIVCLPHFIKITFPKRARHLIAAFIAHGGVLTVSILSYASTYETLAGIRNHVLYPSLFYTTYVMAKQVNRKDIFLFLIKAMYFINVFALFQFLFYYKLPQRLLIVKGAQDFAIDGITAYRCTGLVGDMLVYGGFSTMTFIMMLAYLQIHRKQNKWYSLLAIPAITTVMTFSRISIAGLVIIGGLEYLSLEKGQTSRKALIFIIVIILGFIWLFTSEFGSNILKRFLDTNINLYSNTRHMSTYVEAIKSLRQHFFLGVGMGTQLASSQGTRIVNDGYWWECALELGIPAFCVFMFFFLSSIQLAYKSWKKKYLESELLGVSYFFIALYFLGASCVNSSFESKSNFCLVMILLGLLLAECSKETLTKPGKAG